MFFLNLKKEFILQIKKQFSEGNFIFYNKCEDKEFHLYIIINDKILHINNINNSIAHNTINISELNNKTIKEIKNRGEILFCKDFWLVITENISFLSKKYKLSLFEVQSIFWLFTEIDNNLFKKFSNNIQYEHFKWVD